MSASQTDLPSFGCIFDAVVCNLTPFYLAAAKGDEVVAAHTVLELIKVHKPANPAEMELAGRIVGFAAAAADDLRLSMRPGLSDAKILRFRANAASLGRSGEKCRAALAELQEERQANEQRELEAVVEAKPAAVRAGCKPHVNAKSRPFADIVSELAAMRAAAETMAEATSTPRPAGVA